MKKILIFSFLLSMVMSCKHSNDTVAYLNKVFENLEKIESASYVERSIAWNPGDIVPVYDEYNYVKEINNPNDTTIGASFVNFKKSEQNKLKFAYNGTVRAMVYDDVKDIVIDDFSNNPFPFRPVTPTFFNYAKNIIQYIITTEDSIVVESKELDKDYYIKLTINEDSQVEFFGKAYHMPENPYLFGETTSIYELWISKKNNIPYQIRREMSHSINAISYSDAVFNELSLDDFNIYEYFPADYTVSKYQTAYSKPESDLIGKQAPDWTLTDKDENEISLSDYIDKVVLIQFTGIGCGPCIASIPMLKEIEEKFADEKFKLIAIETWIKKTHSLQNYSKRYGFDYSILCGTDELIKDYQTGSGVPQFFILDKKHIIKSVI
ncbi:MAG: TlpA family protein disulfide reductase, partial [Bacteroidales bacterium]|nr:TlpA family protein disulfide reductase [Bacteroidales bacterium]